MGNIAIITDSDFDEQVLAAEGPVLVSFTATWCASSQNIAPVLRDFAGRRNDVKVAKIDTGGANASLASNDNPEAQHRFNIRIFPTLLLFRNGRVAGMLVGEVDEEKLGAWVDEIISAPDVQTIPVEQFKDFAANYYRQLEDAAGQQARDNMARAVKFSRRLSMVSAFARAAGGFMLATVAPGPVTLLLGATIMGPNALQCISTFIAKDRIPQPAEFARKPLRMAFNFASFAGGALLMSAGAAAPLLTLTGSAGLVLGLCVAWPALSRLGRDIGAMFTTDVRRYPVERPQKTGEPTAP